MKHTATPWKKGTYKNCITAETNDGLTINGAYQDEAIDYYGGYLIAESVSKNNAQFIVKACNSHEELIDALEGMVDTFKTLPTKTNRQQDALDEAQELLTELKSRL